MAIKVTDKRTAKKTITGDLTIRSVTAEINDKPAPKPRVKKAPAATPNGAVRGRRG